MLVKVLIVSMLTSVFLSVTSSGKEAIISFICLNTIIFIMRVICICNAHLKFTL